MCFIIEGFIAEVDLDCLKRMGADWNREMTYIPVFHPSNEGMLECEGFAGKPVKVSVRIEVLPEEEAPEEEKEELDA